MARYDNEVESFHTARAGEISFYFVIISLCIWGIYDYITTEEINIQWILLFLTIFVFLGVKSILRRKNKKEAIITSK